MLLDNDEEEEEEEDKLVVLALRTRAFPKMDPSCCVLVLVNVVEAAVEDEVGFAAMKASKSNTSASIC